MRSLVLLLALTLRLTAAEPADPYLWLEDIEGTKALAWVQERNERTAKKLAAHADYAALYRDALAVLDSASRIPEVQPHGGHLYNFWQDSSHPRGVYRRTTLAELRKENPSWETVLDVDALSQAEGKPWAFNGAVWRRSDHARLLFRLSPGGGDAVEVREFDPPSLQFVRDGFVVPAAKSNAAWRDADSLLVATDFGEGSLTASGYPRMAKLWLRGTPLAAARTLHTADPKSVGVYVSHWGTGGEAVSLVRERVTFWTSKYFHFDGELHPLVLPATADVVDAFRGRLVISLKQDWRVEGRVFRAGSVVLAAPAALRTGVTPDVALLIAASESTVVRDADAATDAVFVTTLDKVRGRLLRMKPDAKSPVTLQFPDNGTLKLVSTDDATGDAWAQFESFVTPPSLYRIRAVDDQPQLIKQQAATFDGARFEVQQLWATSADGTKIPYFVVAPKGLARNGTRPVWMFSYGGFENALTPSYSGSYEDLHGAYGKLWLERGGVFVLANIRGGGEFGPQWHTSVLKEKHYQCFEDFEAVARDLVARKITTPARLGIEGRSNGGLLVAATMLRHPELYGAVVCGNPLVDMQRYHKLLAGASWVAEYGDPDKPEEWAFIRDYSPYQRVHAGLQLPPIMFYTSTRDDRVHPGHARKMMAKMEALGYTVDYYENTEGGHHGSVTNEQLATRLARTYAFLWAKLSDQR